jgi:hypothetical protein
MSALYLAGSVPREASSASTVIATQFAKMDIAASHRNAHMIPPMAEPPTGRWTVGGGWDENPE